MATGQQRQSIEILLSDYAGALSHSEAGKISGFYTSDAVFMPENGPTIKSAQRIGDSAKKFFKTKSLSISYKIKETVVEQDFAFVTIQATAVGLETGKEDILTRDFFVLKHISGSWKIFRYIFNAI